MKIYDLNKKLKEKKQKMVLLGSKAYQKEIDLQICRKRNKDLEVQLKTQTPGIEELMTTIEVLQKQKAEDEKTIVKLEQELRENTQPKHSKYDKTKNNAELIKAQQLYNKLKNTSIKFDKNFEYSINMTDKNDLKILEYSSLVEFPFINRLGIWNPP